MYQGGGSIRQQDNRNTFIVIIIVLIVIAVAAFLLIRDRQSKLPLVLGDGAFQATVLRTESEREKGLSGTDSLAANAAMLFVFPSDGKWSVWMKDMKYPIDIVWLDSNKQVVYLVKRATPESYPDTTYVPRTTARYIVELPAGTIQSKSITMKTKAIFNDEGLAP